MQVRLSGHANLNIVNLIRRDLVQVGIIDRLEASSNQGVLHPAALANGCLDLLGPIEVSEETRSVLVEYADRLGDLDLKDHQPGDEAEQRVGNMLRLVAATREYQLA